MAFCSHLDVSSELAAFSFTSLFSGDPPPKHAYKRTTTSYLEALVYHYRDLYLRLEHRIHAREDGHAERNTKSRTFCRNRVATRYDVFPRQPQYGGEERHAEVDYEQSQADEHYEDHVSARDRVERSTGKRCIIGLPDDGQHAQRSELQLLPVEEDLSASRLEEIPGQLSDGHGHVDRET